MSREIKYRAKRKDTGAFIYGWYVECPFGRWPVTPAIIDSELARSGHYEPVEIDAETLGQYTGLRDKNGKEIYEGDIVRQRRLSCKDGKIVDYLVGFNHYMFTAKDKEHEISLCSIVPCAELEVIGNVHENHELLEG